MKQTVDRFINTMVFQPSIEKLDKMYKKVKREMNEQEVKQKLDELNAPKITPEHVESCIVKEEYHTFEGNTLTLCILTLKNGYTVTGESACASPENFNKELGEHYAKKNAMEKVWPLEAYLLKERLYQENKE